MEKVIKDDQKKEAKQGLSIGVNNKDFAFSTSSPPLPKKKGKVVDRPTNFLRREGILPQVGVQGDVLESMVSRE
jgi:hypothetical protein